MHKKRHWHRIHVPGESAEAFKVVTLVKSTGFNVQYAATLDRQRERRSDKSPPWPPHARLRHARGRAAVQARRPAGPGQSRPAAPGPRLSLVAALLGHQGVGRGRPAAALAVRDGKGAKGPGEATRSLRRLEALCGPRLPGWRKTPPQVRAGSGCSIRVPRAPLGAARRPGPPAGPAGGGGGGGGRGCGLWGFPW
jgi:hypothetical protein